MHKAKVMFVNGQVAKGVSKGREGSRGQSSVYSCSDYDSGASLGGGGGR